MIYIATILRMRNHSNNASSSVLKAHIKSFQMIKLFIRKLITFHNITKKHTSQIDRYMPLTDLSSQGSEYFMSTNFLVLVVASSMVKIEATL